MPTFYSSLCSSMAKLTKIGILPFMQNPLNSSSFVVISQKCTPVRTKRCILSKNVDIQWPFMNGLFLECNISIVPSALNYARSTSLLVHQFRSTFAQILNIVLKIYQLHNFPNKLLVAIEIGSFICSLATSATRKIYKIKAILGQKLFSHCVKSIIALISNMRLQLTLI